MTNTLVNFYQEPLNIDYLMLDVRFQFGDFDATIFSDTMVRTAIVSAVRFLQRVWNGKYQIYRDANKLNPQPADVPAGYVRISSLNGTADVPATFIDGSIFRDPYAVFTDLQGFIEAVDEQAIILAAVYLLRKVQVTSSASEFISWSTEDIRYSNLGTERGLSSALADDLNNLNLYLRSKIGKPKRSSFPIQYDYMTT
jgi:hypothetical protein